MVYCSACGSTDLERLEAHLEEVKELSATHDVYIASLEQKHDEGSVGVSAVQKAYKASDKFEAEIEFIEDKIAAIKRIKARGVK